MKKILLCIVAALCIYSTLLLSCTKSEDTETEKGVIDRITDPLEKARNAKKLAEEYNRKMEENIKKE